MNIEAIQTLSKVNCIESAERINQVIYSTVVESQTERQSLYSEGKLDLFSDFGGTKFQELFSDIIEKVCDPAGIKEKLEDDVEEKVDAIVDEYSKQLADALQISYSTSQFESLRGTMSDVVYSEVDRNLGILDEIHSHSFT